MSKFSGGGGAACGLVDVEEGVAGERGEGSGAAEGVLGPAEGDDGSQEVLVL